MTCQRRALVVVPDSKLTKLSRLLICSLILLDFSQFSSHFIFLHCHGLFSWAEIDPHDNSGAHPKPFRRGKTSIAHTVVSNSASTPATDPTSSYLLSSLASIFDTIQDAPSFTALALAEHEPVGASTVPSALLASIAAGDPRVPVHSEIAEAFAEVAAKRKAAASAARKQQLMVLSNSHINFFGFC
jgi:hypothetical protein